MVARSASLITALLCLVASSALSQGTLGFRYSDALSIDHNGLLANAVVGGFSYPQFSQTDLNQDGVLDLFVFDRASDVWKTFVFDTVLHSYAYAPEFESYFPDEMHEFVLLRDFNCDGLDDVFTYKSGGFMVYEQVANLEFSLVTEALQTDYGSIVTSAYILPGDLPAIVDVDYDGDLDVLAFGNGDAENTIVWHENRSMDELGNCDSLWFEVNTECWGGIMEPFDGTALQQVSCKPNPTPPNPHHTASRVHPGSTVHLSDVDQDQDFDLVLGDILTDQLVYAPNVGSSSSAEIDATQQTSAFPSASDPAVMQYLLNAFDIDVNHDGLEDMVVSVNNNIDSSCNAEHIWFYQKGWSSGQYTLVQRDFLLDQMLDLGSGTVPLVFDADGDGNQDLLVAMDFLRTPDSTANSRLLLFKNNGGTGGEYTYADGDYAELSNFDFSGIHPALGDIDGDGDQDMVIGDLQGRLHLFINNESNGAANFSLSAPNYMGIDVGQYAAPACADLNGDGLLDLIVGQRNGTMSYFENTGTTASAFYDSEPTISKLGGIDVSFFCCDGFAAPRYYNNSALADFPILVVGTSEKAILTYAVPSQPEEAFLLMDSIWVNAGRVCPVLADFDDDGVIELLSGTGEGGLKYWERSSNIKVGAQLPSAGHDADVRVHPNPTTGRVHISLKKEGAATIRVLNLRGQCMTTLRQPTAEASLDLSLLPKGMYILTMETAESSSTRPLIILK